MHDVLGRRARAVGRDQHHDVVQLLAIAAVHALQEGRKRFAAGFARTLVQIVHHVLAEQGEHAVPVAAIERGVVGQDQFRGAVVGAGAVDLHRESLRDHRRRCLAGPP